MFRRNSQRIFGSGQFDQRLEAGLITHLVGGGSGNTWINRGSRFKSTNGILQGGASWSLGQGNKRAAVKFDGTDDNVALGNPYPALGTEYTVSAWVNTNTITAPAAQVVASYRSSSGSNPIIFQMDISNATVRFLVRDDAGNISTAASGNLITIGSWFHILGVRRGNSTAIWVNGVAAASGGATWGTITANLLSVGCTDQNGSKSGFFNGRIDDVRIYNRVLSLAERVLLASPSFSPVVPVSRRFASTPAAASASRTARLSLLGVG